MGFDFGTQIQSTQSTSQDIIESNIIIVEPICSDDKIRSSLNNDLLLAKSLNNSVINESGIKMWGKICPGKSLFEIVDNEKIADIKCYNVITMLNNIA